MLYAPAELVIARPSASVPGAPEIPLKLRCSHRRFPPPGRRPAVVLDAYLLCGRIMRSQILYFRLCAFILVPLVLFGPAGNAQEKPKPESTTASTSKPQFPAPKQS